MLFTEYAIAGIVLLVFLNRTISLRIMGVSFEILFFKEVSMASKGCLKVYGQQVGKSQPDWLFLSGKPASGTFNSSSAGLARLSCIAL